MKVSNIQLPLHDCRGIPSSLFRRLARTVTSYYFSRFILARSISVRYYSDPAGDWRLSLVRSVARPAYQNCFICFHAPSIQLIIRILSPLRPAFVSRRDCEDGARQRGGGIGSRRRGRDVMQRGRLWAPVFSRRCGRPPRAALIAKAPDGDRRRRSQVVVAPSRIPGATTRRARWMTSRPPPAHSHWYYLAAWARARQREQLPHDGST